MLQILLQHFHSYISFADLRGRMCLCMFLLVLQQQENVHQNHNDLLDKSQGHSLQPTFRNLVRQFHLYTEH